MRCPYCGDEDLPEDQDEAWDQHLRDCQPATRMIR